MKMLEPAIRLHFVILIISILCTSCAFKSVVRTKNVTYLQDDVYKNIPEQKLNVFVPRKKTDKPRKTIVFIHGGSWNSGRKEQYNFLGNRMARKGVNFVVIDYPLSPKATYHQMVMSAAYALSWTKDNIAKFGGDANSIFLAGHSAGGHIASLLTVDNSYFDSLKIVNPIAGTILIDAAGLDMLGYLRENKFPADHNYIKTFTNNQSEWRQASPIYHLHQSMPPIIMYVGERTYPSLKKANDKFHNAVQAFAPSTKLIVVRRKKHVAMITQFFWTWNPLYDSIQKFIERK